MVTEVYDAKIGKELEQYDADLSWVLENYASLIKKHGNEFVAVLNRKVLAHASTIQQLTEVLGAKFKEDAHRAVIEFIYPEHPNLVLPHACHM